MKENRQREEWKSALVWNGTLLAAVLCYMVFMVKTGIYCPIRHFTGIPCAGCGMSRALGCLLHLDIGGSLRNNPSLIPCVIAAFFTVNRETAVLSAFPVRVKDMVIGAGFGFTLTVYLIRLLFFEIP